MHILLKILFPYSLIVRTWLYALHGCIVLLGLLALVACERQVTVPELDVADSLIERRPDSALALLQHVDTLHLTSRHARARYAMLMSMALDKNYIDLKDFRVLQPAIDYYENHGTPTEQLRTFYYQGRIYDNAGNMSKALQTYMKSLERGKESNDFPTKARVYCAQIGPYLQLKSFDKAIEAGKQALVYNQYSGRMDSYALCLIYIANAYALKNDQVNSWKYLNECRKLWPYMSKKRKQSFYNNYLIAVYSFCGKDSIRKVIEEYEANIPSDDWNNLTLAYAYTQINNFEQARFLASRYKLHTFVDEDCRYYSMLNSSYKCNGIHINNLFKFFVWCEVSKSFTRSII